MNMNKKEKKIIFSGIQPSGIIHLGNYLGAMRQWLELQAEYECIFSIVDYHAITVRQKPESLKRQIMETAKIYLACGIDPEKSVIFQQSKISAHPELAWILNCVARVSDLNKMTQFKEKAGRDKEGASVGLYTYPVLMAADILLYDTDLVPVGEDQTQHVELCRVLARRFNDWFGPTFKAPEVKIKKEGARIMGLDNPAKKMSKSASAANYLALTDDPDTARKKIKRAVTDSGAEIKYAPEKKPAISNLLTIYSLLSGHSISELERQYEGRGYGDFKKDLAETVADFLACFQEKFNRISDREVKEILEAGAEKAGARAADKLLEVKKRIGVIL